MILTGERVSPMRKSHVELCSLNQPEDIGLGYTLLLLSKENFLSLSRW